MFIVKHKNPANDATEGGTKWAEDGPFETEADASGHAVGCQHDELGIPFEIVDLNASEEEETEIEIDVLNELADEVETDILTKKPAKRKYTKKKSK